MIGVGYICQWAVIVDFRKEVNKNFFVSGLVYGHQTYADGTLIYTSDVISTDGRNFVTRSGSCYTLAGEPDKEWAMHCRQNDPNFDTENPFKSFMPQVCKTIEDSVK